MNMDTRIILLAHLIGSLRKARNWGGATHVQKAVFTLQQLGLVDFGYSFVLYKHGPYSFDLRNDLTGLIADGFIEHEVVDPSYGPKLRLSERCNALLEKSRDKIKPFVTRVEFVCTTMSSKGVAELERITTALFLYSDKDGFVDTPKEQISRLIKAKPHISPEDAESAYLELGTILEAKKRLQEQSL